MPPHLARHARGHTKVTKVSVAHPLALTAAESCAQDVQPDCRMPRTQPAPRPATLVCPPPPPPPPPPPRRRRRRRRRRSYVCVPRHLPRTTLCRYYWRGEAGGGTAQPSSPCMRANRPQNAVQLPPPSAAPSPPAGAGEGAGVPAAASASVAASDSAWVLPNAPLASLTRGTTAAAAPTSPLPKPGPSKAAKASAAAAGAAGAVAAPPPRPRQS